MAVVGRQRIVFSGEAAVVRLGYQKAATLGAWTVDGGWLTAAVTDFDSFRLTQTPLALEVRYRDGSTIRRPLGDVTVAAGRLSARLLPKQER